MKIFGVSVVVLLAILFMPSATRAGDFDWIRSLNIQAQADPSGFRLRLATRFNIGDAQIQAVLSNVERPADAYVFLRLGEMSGQPPKVVIERYKTSKGKGWGALAKSLGIKPGSEDFHALKRGHDLYDDHGDNDRVKGNAKGKGEKGDKGRSKGKHKGKGSK